MKSLYFVFLISLITTLFLFAEVALAQTSQRVLYDSTLDKSDVRIGLRYTSDYLYMGRADSAKAPYLSPSIGYYHKSGIFISGSLSYLMATGEGRIDLFTLSGGYDHYGKKHAVGFSIAEYIFSDLSYAVQAEMNTYMNAYFGYDFSAFMVYMDASLGLSESADAFLGLEINRTLYALKNKLRITPAVYVNAGSQQYYNEYYTMRSNQTGSGMGSGKNAKPPSNQNIQILESSKFRILDYEANLQVTYKVKNVRLFVSTTWTFPVNPSTVVTDQTTYTEELNNGFFLSSGFRITL